MTKETYLYYSLNQFLKETFGEKVKKIPLDAGLSCPNRDGSKGKGGCIYCDPKGSGTGLYQKMSIKEQLNYFIERFKQKKYQKFIAYFQSFSNTYAPLEKLEELYSNVYNFPEVVGLAIGTRPDCISPEVVELLKKFQTQGYHVWIELGLQSIHNETLKKINRGHTFEDFVYAFELLRKNRLSICVHLIFGLPGEDKEKCLQTVKTVAKLEPEGVKFHALYILKDAPIAKLYQRGEVVPLELMEYIELVGLALTFLSPKTVIHRLTSDPPRENLLAPLWLLNKNDILKKLNEFMKAKNLYQGKNFS